MPIDPSVLSLVKAAGLNFFVQENDIIQLALDRQLGGSPYLQPFEKSLATTASNVDGQDTIDAEEGGTTASQQYFMIPEGEVWVLSKITHRDIEAGIFTVHMKIDGSTIFPSLVMESAYYLLELPKAVFCSKYFYTKVTNGDTTTKTYRHLRHWQRYSKSAVNKFLEEYGIERIR